MTKKEALKQFNELVRPNIPKGDKPALRGAWTDFTDFLQKAGNITVHQYSFWKNPF